MRVVVLVPRRSDNGRRDQVWEYVRSRWDDEHPTWPIYEGHHDEGPFNRSAAINSAARDARQEDWDVAIVADSDTFVGPAQIDEAVNGCFHDGRMWLAYDRFCYLSRQMSDAVMNGFQGSWETGVEWWLPGTCSSMVVVRNDVWTEAGGFDEGFAGWGLEDVAASHAFQTFGEGLSRAPGPAWHIWHSPQTEERENSPSWKAKVERAERYHAAAYDKPAMRALIDELHDDVRV